MYAGLFPSASSAPCSDSLEPGMGGVGGRPERERACVSLQLIHGEQTGYPLINIYILKTGTKTRKFGLDYPGESSAIS